MTDPFRILAFPLNCDFVSPKVGLVASATWQYAHHYFSPLNKWAGLHFSQDRRVLTVFTNWWRSTWARQGETSKWISDSHLALWEISWIVEFGKPWLETHFEVLWYVNVRNSPVSLWVLSIIGLGHNCCPLLRTKLKCEETWDFRIICSLRYIYRFFFF